MGYASIVIFTLCLSFMLQFGMGYDTAFTSLGDYFIGKHYDPTTGGYVGSGNSNNFLAIMGGLVGVGTVLLSALFPNPYLIFSTVFVGLLALVSFPLNLLTEADMPVEIKVFGTTIFGVLYLLAWLFAYKGGSD